MPTSSKPLELLTITERKTTKHQISSTYVSSCWKEVATEVEVNGSATIYALTASLVQVPCFLMCCSSTLLLKASVAPDLRKV